MRFPFQACDDDYLRVQHQLPLTTDFRRFKAIVKWVSPFGMRDRTEPTPLSISPEEALEEDSELLRRSPIEARIEFLGAGVYEVLAPPPQSYPPSLKPSPAFFRRDQDSPLQPPPTSVHLPRVIGDRRG